MIRTDTEGHYTMVAGHLMGHRMAFICVYAPNTDSLDLFYNLHAR